MRGITALIGIGLVLVLLDSRPDPVASADERTVTCTKTGSCTNISRKDGQQRLASVTRRSSSDNRPNSKKDGAPTARKKFAAALAAYDRQMARYGRCLQANPNGTGCNQPNSPWFRTNTFSGAGNQPISAGQAAAMAVARLQLPTIAPGIGPSPELNPWKMAAVGYPLWLWADGPTHVGPITDSVGGLSVSLDADVSSLTFRMGDGHSINCAGSGHEWTPAVKPGAKSPSCGYSYSEPSLPGGKYTVAAVANWAVTWTSNGQSGVIDVPAVATTELPVGELQVLVR
jgi:hypothetical protein